MITWIKRVPIVFIKIYKKLNEKLQSQPSTLNNERANCTRHRDYKYDLQFRSSRNILHYKKKRRAKEKKKKEKKKLHSLSPPLFRKILINLLLEQICSSRNDHPYSEQWKIEWLKREWGGGSCSKSAELSETGRFAWFLLDLLGRGSSNRYARFEYVHAEKERSS